MEDPTQSTQHVRSLAPCKAERLCFGHQSEKLPDARPIRWCATGKAITSKGSPPSGRGCGNGSGRSSPSTKSIQVPSARSSAVFLAADKPRFHRCRISRPNCSTCARITSSGGHSGASSTKTHSTPGCRRRASPIQSATSLHCRCTITARVTRTGACSPPCIDNGEEDPVESAATQSPIMKLKVRSCSPGSPSCPKSGYSTISFGAVIRL
jgi:hypothetical protein